MIKQKEPWPQYVEIYAIEHISSKDAYVGSTYRGYEKRYLEHLYFLTKGTHCSPKLQNKWIKHKESSFRILLLDSKTCKNSQERIIFEAEWVDKRGTLNSRPVSEDNVFFAMSDEAKEKMSHSIRQMYNDRPELRDMASIRMKKNNPGCQGRQARWKEPDAKKKYSDKMKAYWSNLENKQKQSEFFKINNPMFDPEKRQKHTEIMQSKEYKEKQGKHSKEVRWAKVGAKDHYSLKMKAYWANPENREKQAKKQRAAAQRKKAKNSLQILASCKAMLIVCISNIEKSGTR